MTERMRGQRLDGSDGSDRKCRAKGPSEDSDTTRLGTIRGFDHLRKLMLQSELVNESANLESASPKPGIFLLFQSIPVDIQDGKLIRGVGRRSGEVATVDGDKANTFGEQDEL